MIKPEGYYIRSEYSYEDAHLVKIDAGASSDSVARNFILKEKYIQSREVDHVNSQLENVAKECGLTKDETDKILSSRPNFQRNWNKVERMCWSKSESYESAYDLLSHTEIDIVRYQFDTGRMMIELALQAVFRKIREHEREFPSSESSRTVRKRAEEIRHLIRVGDHRAVKDYTIEDFESQSYKDRLPFHGALLEEARKISYITRGLREPTEREQAEYNREIIKYWAIVAGAVFALIGALVTIILNYKKIADLFD